MQGIRTRQSADRYVPLDVIGKGGMAEVFRCKLVGEKGFEKLIVLKKLLPEAARDSELVTNFIDEARLAALLQHENIAHIYNFGEFDNSFFIAMEYLFGKDLHSIMVQARERKHAMGVEHALLVALKICEGMEYAHKLKDLRQRPLNIIHRDLTPHNVFVTYDGNVKIIDFGIAKAELYDHRTQAGVVKGKISYMSPEQLVGNGIDRRSDIFSIGILLYEMLSGKRMYRGDTATLIRKCLAVEYDPLETVAPGLPTAVYSILRNALIKDKERRYQSCLEMIRDLEDCLFAIKKYSHRQLLKEYILTLFGDEYEKEKTELSGLRDTEDDSTEFNGADFGSIEQTIIEDVTLPELPEQTVQTTYLNYENPSLKGKAHTWLVRMRGKMTDLLDRLGWKTWAVVGGGLIGGVIIMSVFSRNPGGAEPLMLGLKLPAEVTTDLADTGRNPALQEQIKDSAREILVEYVSTKEELESLLAKGRTAITEGRLTTPGETSALKYYREVLKRDPDNNVAMDGLRVIGEQYAELVEKSLGHRNLAGARDFLEKGLAVSPDNHRLALLRERIEREKLEHVDYLRSKAEEALRRNKLTTPYNQSAYKYYKDIRQITGNGEDAREVLRQIGNRYAVLGEVAHRDFKFTQARSYVSKGLEIAPSNKRLLSLKQELAKSKPEVFFSGLEKKLNSIFQ
ncbi:serine/threonine-protein kinase [Desulfopila sp. IMCC35008]|uniref:serine/threonine-protein kinase n=1 Tax=Desulfopila sp. IMCC35008 TaxID=2653858 RepID=UPI0013CF67E2|nr:serine/threonine-protein kinase [Desulfopila sp. IMCC35008]